MKLLIQRKKKVLVAQSCLTFCDPLDGSLLGSSVHGIFQARILEWVDHSLLQGIFPIQGLNPGLLHCRQILIPSEPQGKPNSKDEPLLILELTCADFLSKVK